jgi:hypothetical protein
VTHGTHCVSIEKAHTVEEYLLAISIHLTPTPSSAPHPKEHAPDTNHSEQWRLRLWRRRQAPPTALGRPSHVSQAPPTGRRCSSGGRLLHDTSHINNASCQRSVPPHLRPVSTTCSRSTPPSVSLPPVILHSESSDHMDYLLTMVLVVDSSAGPVFLSLDRSTLL